MNRSEFEEEQTGEPVESEVQDAAEQEEVEETETEIDENDQSQSEETEAEESDDLPELPEEHKNAFQKRLEREQKKIREKAEAELKQQYDQQYSKHKSIIDMLGGDPDAVEKRIRENQMRDRIRGEVTQAASVYGWDDEQTEQVIQQRLQEQKRDQEIAELRVQVQINDLKDNPVYEGIGKMKQEIMGLIERSGHTLTAEQAFWALGGKNRAEQLKREAEQREIAKRSKAKRTVQSDSPTSTTGEKPLDAETERLRKKMGLTVKEARELMQDGPDNLEAYRKLKKG